MEDLQFLHQGFDRETVDSREEIGHSFSAWKHLISPVVIVEDDAIFGKSLQRFLSHHLERPCYLFSTAESCLEHFSDRPPTRPFALITDIHLDNGHNGSGLVEILSQKGLRFFSVTMTGFGSIECAIEATKKGVDRYLTKPFELDGLRQLILRGLEEKFFSFYRSSPAKIGPSDQFFGIVGRSSAMKNLFQQVREIKKTSPAILISGGPGSGRSSLAKVIHLQEQRPGPFIKINCGAIPADLLESELFGKKGGFELANGGTLFLDEVSAIPDNIQLKIFRFLQYGEIFKRGSKLPTALDIQLIVSTSKNLAICVREGNFRTELYEKLRGFSLVVPDLRLRKDDIPLLIESLLQKIVSGDNRNQIFFRPETHKVLFDYDWPGNIAELENLLERLVVLHAGREIFPEDLPSRMYKQKTDEKVGEQGQLLSLPSEGLNLKKFIQSVEHSLIHQALEKTGYNKNQAAKLLSMNRTTLIEKLKKISFLQNLTRDSSSF